MAEIEEDAKERDSPPEDQQKAAFFKLAVAFAVVTGLVIGLILAVRIPGKAPERRSPLPEQIERLQRLDPFFVPLESKDGERRFLRITITLQYVKREVADEIIQRMPELRAIIYDVLASGRYEVLRRGKQMAGLKFRILEALNRELKDGRIEKIFFSDFLVY